MKTSTEPTFNKTSVSEVSRFYGSFWAFFIGDALAMPGHGYSNHEILEQDYGKLIDYRLPKYPHPESTLFRIHYEVINEKNNILHGKEREWATPGTHYHHHLQAGDNTLNILLARELAKCLVENEGYDQEKYLQRYIEFMLSPDSHNDTYIPEAHRNFFTNYARGKDPYHCAEQSSSMGGIASAFPLALFYRKDPDQASWMVRKHLALTHAGEPIARAAQLVVEILFGLIRGWDLEYTLFDYIKSFHPHGALSFPYRRWRDRLSDDEVIKTHLKTCSNVDYALPLLLYLLLKYGNDTEQALIVSANLGGDSCPRGAVLGALAGAYNGCESIPAEWVENLNDFEQLDQLCDAMYALSA